jgi:hypothetical protein
MLYLCIYDILGTAEWVILAKGHHHYRAQEDHWSHFATALAATHLLLQIEVLLAKDFQLVLETLHLVSFR